MEGTGLNPVEQQLVAAVKAGDELDLSTCPKGERTLRASVLRDILRDHAVAEPGAGVRLRSAVIEGDLDLSQVETTMTLELTNCQVTRICLGGRVFLDSSSVPVPGDRDGSRKHVYCEA